MKIITNIKRNENGSIDITDSDGITYLNCWLKSYSDEKDSTIECNIDDKDFIVNAERFKKAFGFDSTGENNEQNKM